MDELEQQAQDLQIKISNIEHELRQLNDKAESRALTPGEQTLFDRQLRALEKATGELEEVRDAQREQVAELARDERRLDGHESVTGRRSPEYMRRVDPSDNSFGMRDRALAIVGDERRDASRHLLPEQRARVDGLLRKNTGDLDGAHLAQRLLLTENDAYRSAFWRLVTRTNPALLPEQARAVQQMEDFQAAEQRAMAIGSDGAGGYGVPVLIDPTIILTAQENPNDILNLARVETITTDEWKGVSSAGVTWSFDAEAAEVSDDSPTLAQPTVPTHKAQGFIPYSIEVGGDYPNFAAEMSRLLNAGYQELLASSLTNGTGSGQPTGIVTALDANTNVEVVVTTDGTFSAADVYKLWSELPIKYRRAASWMSSTDVMNEVRQFAGPSGASDANFSVNITQESIPRLFGKPYYENDFMADFTGTTGAANLLIVGDFSNYLIAQRAGMNVELVPHLFGVNNMPTGQRGWYAWARVGADSVNDLGFRILQNQ